MRALIAFPSSSYPPLFVHSNLTNVRMDSTSSTSNAGSESQVSTANTKNATQSLTSSVSLSLAEGVDKELTCAICLGRYKHPKVLPCLHSYCKSCLEGLLKASQHQEKKQITCPQCKESHTVPQQGVDSFKTYFTINNLLELLHIHEVSSEGVGDAILCESGLDENPAFARCLSCAEYLCESCFTIHQRLKATKDHNMLTLEKIKQSDKRLGVKSVQRRQHCEEHEGEVLKLFCKTCEKVICRDCALVKHRDHDYSFIREVRPDTQKSLEGLQKEVEEKLKEFRANKAYIEGLQNAGGDVLNSCLKEVNETCDKLIEVVETRRAALIGNLHSVHEMEEVKRKQELSNIDTSLVRLSDSIHFTHNLLDSGDDVEMMTVGLQAMEALKGLKKMTWNKESIKPTLLRLTFSPLVTKVQSFGKVHNTVLLSDVFAEGVPTEAYTNTEVKFTIKLSHEISKRKYNAASLLTVKVTCSDSPARSRPLYTTIRNVDMNKWTVSVTPKETGLHTVEIKIGNSASKTHQFRVIRKSLESSQNQNKGKVHMTTTSDASKSEVQSCYSYAQRLSSSTSGSLPASISSTVISGSLDSTSIEITVPDDSTTIFGYSTDMQRSTAHKGLRSPPTASTSMSNSLTKHSKLK